MEVLVNTDSNIDCDAEEVSRIKAGVTSAFGRFDHSLTRIEVHLRDESAGRGTGDDIRCLLEARPARQDPVTVSHQASTLDEALGGATDKLESLLTHKFDRLTDKDRRDTIRGR